MAISRTGGARPERADSARRRTFIFRDSRKQRCRQAGIAGGPSLLKLPPRKEDRVASIRDHAAA
jgi:hypothetical protein